MIRADFSFDIPLEDERVQMASEALSLIRRRAFWALEDSQNASFVQAFPAVGTVGKDARNPDLAMAFYSAIRAAFEQGGEDAGTQQGSLHCEAHIDRLSVTVAAGHDSASYHYAIGVIQACQNHLGSPAVGFRFTEIVQGKWYGGGVVVAPGSPPEILEAGEDADPDMVDQWIGARLEASPLGSRSTQQTAPDPTPTP